MNYPAAELRGIICYSSPSNNVGCCLKIGSDHGFVSIQSHRVDVISARPELTSPQHAFHFRMVIKDLLCRNTLDCLHHPRWKYHGHGLDKKMHMILIAS